MRRLPFVCLLAFLAGFVLAACGPSEAEIYCTKINGMAQSHTDTLAAAMSCQSAKDAENTRAAIAIGSGLVAGSAIGGRR